MCYHRSDKLSVLHRQTGCIFCPPPSVPHANMVISSSFFVSFFFLSASETWRKRATEEVAEIVFTHAKHVLITDRSLLWVWSRAEASYRHESRGDVTSPHCARYNAVIKPVRVGRKHGEECVVTFGLKCHKSHVLTDIWVPVTHIGVFKADLDILSFI